MSKKNENIEIGMESLYTNIVCEKSGPWGPILIPVEELNKMGLCYNEVTTYLTEKQIYNLLNICKTVNKKRKEQGLPNYFKKIEDENV